MQMRNSRQNDKLELWVMYKAFKDEVLGSILGSKKQKFYPCLIVSVVHFKHFYLFQY